MRYHNITTDDMLNGEGLRTVLWTAGCGHQCKGCQNPVTWDPEGGLLFDEAAETELFAKLGVEGLYQRADVQRRRPAFSCQPRGSGTAGGKGETALSGKGYLALYGLPLGGNQRTADNGAY